MKGAACCAGRGRLCRLARRFSEGAASALPAAALVLLPKCPACLAVWLAAGTGIGISAAAASRLRGGLVVFCVLALCVSAARLVWRQSASAR